jgi:hypothetical protein
VVDVVVGVVGVIVHALHPHWEYAVLHCLKYRLPDDFPSPAARCVLSPSGLLFWSLTLSIRQPTVL